jgi:glycosyltransferase involved in cell wall biosynthesis
MTPQVSCICPTTESRKSFLPTAIQCFLDQDYPSKEMVILTEGTWVMPLVPLHKQIRIVIMPDERPLGTKRNAACYAARGEFIVQFDDDDYSAPGRISDQVKRLEESGKALTGYNPMLFRETRAVERWEPDGSWAKTSEWWRLENPITIGASFCYRRDWWQSHPFPDAQYGEDDAFWMKAAALEETVTVDSGGFMYMVNHRDNVTGRAVNSAWQEVPLAEAGALFPESMC